MVNLKMLEHLQDLKGKNIKYICWSFGYNGSLMITHENEFLYWELEIDTHWNKPVFSYKDSYDLYQMLMAYCDGGEYGNSDFADDLVECKVFTQEEINEILKDLKEKEKLEEEQKEQNYQEKLSLYYKLKSELGL